MLLPGVAEPPVRNNDDTDDLPDMDDLDGPDRAAKDLDTDEDRVRDPDETCDPDGNGHGSAYDHVHEEGISRESCGDERAEMADKGVGSIFEGKFGLGKTSLCFFL